MRVSFIWQGFNGRYGLWKDGLWAAMQLIGKEHDVGFFDTTDLDTLRLANPDVVLYWEAPCTFAGKDRENYWNIQDLPYKKALLFAGGPVKKEWCDGFDLFFVESAINEKEFGDLGLPWKRAFGVNTQIMRPEQQPKVFDGVMQATCASWKRHWLLADALQSKAAIAGRFQESDPIGFMRARKAGAAVFPELSAEGVAALLNMSHTMVNCADEYGGGQRATLEAMACGIPVVVMSDSPKNMEYVQESDAGIICDPSSEMIKIAVDVLKKEEGKSGQKGVDYIQSRWTEKHYAEALLAGIKSI